MLSPSIFLLALLVQAFSGYARPIGSNSSVINHLERRIKPGSYSIMTPAKNMVIFDPDTKSFCVYVKFGDGAKIGRLKDYTTHNPIFDFHYKASRKKGAGKLMEKATLVQLAQDETVVQVQNDDGAGLEWYQVDLGKDKADAVARKSALREKMEAYEVHEDAKGYANEFNELLRGYTVNKLPKDKMNTPSTPRKDSTPSTPEKSSKTPKKNKERLQNA